jgi:hypothetical protein
MGTRGYIVVKIGNKYYMIYNHADSYPSYLGQKIVNMLNWMKYTNKLPKDELGAISFLLKIKTEMGKDNIPEIAGKVTSNATSHYPDGTDASGMYTHNLKLITDFYNKTKDIIDEIEVSDTPRNTDRQIEWVYLLDTFNMTLSIKGGYYAPILQLNLTKHFIMSEECEYCNKKLCECCLSELILDTKEEIDEKIKKGALQGIVDTTWFEVFDKENDKRCEIHTLFQQTLDEIKKLKI